MKFTLNLLLILVSLFNQAIAIRPISYASAQPKAQAGVGTTPTPAAIPTPQPTAAPTPAAMPTPPAPVNRLSLKTNLNCVAPGQDLSLDWDFQPAPEWAGRESELELVVTLPSTFTPDSKGWTRFDAQTGTGRLPLSKTGKLRGKLAQEKKTAGAVTVNAKVVNGEKVIAEATLQVGQGSLSEIAARGGEAANPDNQIKVAFPEGALKEDVVVCIREISTSDHAAPLFGGRSFEIEAQGKSSGAAVKQFARNLEISYPYDPAEIGGDEANLSLVYYDETAQRWKYLASMVDTTHHVITGYSNHLTEFSYDINSVDKYRIQDFSAFQVSEYSGAASYSVPLTVPPGPAGLAPDLTLTYSSSIPDSAGPHSQASWVGMGWELSPGAISRNTNGTQSLADDTFSLQLGGQGGMLLPIRSGTDATVGSDTYGKSYVEYEVQDATFMRIRRYDVGYGFLPNNSYPHDLSFWRVWDQGGTAYTFKEGQNYTLYAGYDYPANPNYDGPTVEIARWPLTEIKSVSGQKIDYSYETYWASRNKNIGGGYQSIDDMQLFLRKISYANNHYVIQFEDEARGDVDDECISNDEARCAVDVKRLHAVGMYYNPDGDAAMADLALIRRYLFNYVEGGSTGIFPNTRWPHGNNPYGYTSTLVSLQEYGKDNNIALPAMTFTYADRMHLTDASNGYNGKIHFVYASAPWPNGTPPWSNGSAGGTPLKQWRGANTAQQDYPKWIFVPGSGLPTGRNIWMQMDVVPSNNTAVSFALYKPGYWLGSPDIPTNGVSGPYSYILTLPLDLVDDATYQLVYSCFSIVTRQSACSFDGYVQYGSVAARYRVTEKWLYPDASLPAHDIYQYQYVGAAMNDASLSSVTPASDFTADKVITPPYTEFRGHAQVKTILPDGNYTLTNYHQTDRLAGKVSSSALYNGTNNHKLSETIYTYATPVELPIPNTGAVGASLPKYGATIKADAKIWWTPLATVEKRTYAGDGVNYIATKADTTYVLDGTGKPVYGEVRSVVESENNGNGWTVVRKKFSTYTSTDVATDIRYFVGHPSSTAVCSANGSESNAEYLICGSNASDYYGFTSYYYTTLGQIYKVVNLLNFTGAPTHTYANRYSDFTQYTYDSYGNVSAVGQGYKDQNTLGVVEKTTTSCYQAETADRTANPPCTDYTGAGVNGVYLSWVKNSLSQVTHYVNDARLGQSSKQIDPNGAETSVTYDEFGRLSTVRKPGDSGATPTLQFTYNLPAAGVSSFFWTEATQKLDETKTLKVRKFYNGIGELIQTQQAGVKVDDPACSAETCVVVTDQKTEYVSGVKTTTQTAPYAVATPTGSVYITPTWQNVTVTTYDAEGRPLMVKAPSQTAATSQRFSYGLDGTLLKTTTTDPNNNITESWQDVWGRTRQVKAADGPVLVYNYDIANRLTSIEQRNRSNNNLLATTSLTYDVAGRKTQMVDPDMGTWNYGYDAYGNLTWQTDARNRRICLVYDGLNRLTGKEYPTGATCSGTNLPVTFSYDDIANGNKGIGRRTGMIDLSGSTTWKYDERGRMVREMKTITGAGIFQTQWTYNAADQVQTMTYPGGADGGAGEVVTNTYNAQMAPTGLTGTETYLKSATYDAAGRVKTRGYGNSGQLETFTYNPWTTSMGLLQQHQVAGGLLDMVYTYDGNGNVLTINDNALTAPQTQTFSYDALNRLASAKACLISTPATCDYDDTGTKVYGYDNYGRLTTQPGGTINSLIYADANHIHAVTNAGDGSSYGYDANGNTIARNNVPVGQTTKSYTLGYDAENRLVDVSNGAVANFIYDGDGNRVLGTVDGVSTVYIGNYYETPLGQVTQLNNPDFETRGTAPYTAANWTVQNNFQSLFPATSYISLSWGLGAGNNSTYGQAISNLAYGMIRSDAITVTAGAQYDLRAYVRGRIDQEESIVGWHIRAFFYDNHDTWVSQVDAATSKAITADWQQKGGIVTVPDGVSKMRIGLYAVEISGWVAFDDVSLIRVGDSNNLAVNASFEQATNWSEFDETGGKFPGTGYFRYGWGIATPHTGNYAYAISNLAYTVLQADMITLEAGAQYDLYTYVRSALDPSMTVGTWILRARYFDTEGKFLSFSNIADSSPLTTTWQRFGGRFTPPANAAKIQIQLYDSMSSGWVAFDDVSLVKVGGSGMNLVLNPSFETGNDILPTHWTKSGEAASNFPASSYWRGTWGVGTPHSGTYAYATGNLAYGDLKSDVVTARGNMPYELTIYAQGYRDMVTSNGAPRIKVVALDVNNTPLAWSGSTDTWLYLTSMNITNSAAYQKYSASFITPANTAKLSVELFAGMTNGWVSFDDVSLKLAATKYYSAGGQRIARRVGSGSVEYLFSDHLGSSSVVTNSSFAKISEMRYTAWGKPRLTSGTIADNAFAYTGQRQEAGIGLDFYNARWYDPALGRFAQADTIVPDPGKAQSFDRYSYVNNNSLKYNDPSGHTISCGSAGEDGCDGGAIEDTVIFYLSGLGGHEPDPTISGTRSDEYNSLYFALRRLVGSDNLVYVPLFKSYDKIKSHLEMAQEAWGSGKPQTNQVVNLIEKFMSNNPGKRLVIVGSSAGGTVAIEALDILKDKGISVDQVILRGSFVSELVLQNVGRVDYIAADPPTSDYWYSVDVNPFDSVQVQEHIISGFSGHVPPNALVMQKISEIIYQSFFNARK